MTRAHHLSLSRHEGRGSEQDREQAVLVREVSAVLASTTSFAGALPRVLEALHDTLDAAAVHAWVHRPLADRDDADPPGNAGDGRRPHGPAWTHVWHPDPPPSAFDGMRAAMSGAAAPSEDREARSGDDSVSVEPAEPHRSPAAADALTSRWVVRIDDVRRLAPGAWKNLVLDAGVHGVAALPVFAGERPVAVLELFFATPLDAAALSEDNTLTLVRSELERRVEYDRMRSAVRRSARLWRGVKKERETPETAADESTATTGAATVTLTGPGQNDLYHASTGLPGRSLFLDRIDHTLAKRSRQPDRLFALVVFVIEDSSRETAPGTYRQVRAQGGGRQLRDGADDERSASLVEAVRVLGRRLRENVRPGDSVGHVSAASLGILVEDVSSRTDAASVARRLEEQLREQEFDLLADTGTRIRVGVALAGPAHETAEDVADDALADADRREG